MMKRDAAFPFGNVPGFSRKTLLLLSVVLAVLLFASGAAHADTADPVEEDTSIALALGTPLDVTINAGETVYFSFTPTETADYVFSSQGDADTYGYVYDSGRTVLASDDDSGDDYNFSVSYTLNAGTLYYFGARLYGSDSGAATVRLDKTDTHTAGGFTYRILSDGTAGITACSLTGDIVIPDKLDGYTVTNLAEKLFYGKSNVTSVTIPAHVTFFGTDRNDNDWDYVFSYCYDLQNIYVDSANTVFRSIDGVLYSKNGSKLINYPCNHPGEIYHVTAGTLCCTSFAGCGNLRFLFLDNPSTTWYTYTFYDTDRLTSFYIAGGAAERKAQSEISQGRTFLDASVIATLPASLTRIESGAFQGSGVQYLIIPDSCMEIASGAFTDSSLVYVRLNGSAMIAADAFDSSVVFERK